MEHLIVLHLTERHHVRNTVFRCREDGLANLVHLLPVAFLRPVARGFRQEFLILLPLIMAGVEDIFHIILHKGED